MSRTYTLDELGTFCNLIAEGGVVAYPTEAVFGLGCDPFNEAAVQRVFRLKRRDPAQGFLVIAASEAQLQPFVDWTRVTARQRRAIAASWPGPTTWVLPRSQQSPAAVSGAHGGIAARVTAHPAAVALCRAFGGALVSTSANLHGQPPARSLGDIQAGFAAGDLDGVLDAPLGGLRNPSAILDALTGCVIRSAQG
ncbi:MAG: Sua5/YciO/YrdC/YwlC family protein [Hydrogenophaga sp.]|nr:Sua5/YciO/YrdC/YwlC family protein [Hydrogenophaga sp.]